MNTNYIIDILLSFETDVCRLSQEHESQLNYCGCGMQASVWYFYNISGGWYATEYYICTQKPVSELKRSTESQLCAQCKNPSNTDCL